jgi:hypothetical protein
VQSKEPFPIWIKICPSHQAYYSLQEGKESFNAKLRINFIQKDGKANYVPVSVTGALTSTDVELTSNDNHRWTLARCQLLKLKY